MATLPPERILDLLEPFYAEITLPESVGLIAQLSGYLDLLLKWNARTNLSAIREPEQIVRRHFGESLFVAAHLPPCKTLLDLGSGAGFPGLPVALARPHVQVTLAESQNKKAAFLREVARTLGVQVEVWAGRAEDLPTERLFDVVTLRAVDRPAEAILAARQRLAGGGWLVHLASASDVSGSLGDSDNLHTMDLHSMEREPRELPVPGSERLVLRISR